MRSFFETMWRRGVLPAFEKILPSTAIRTIAVLEHVVECHSGRAMAGKESPCERAGCSEINPKLAVMDAWEATHHLQKLDVYDLESFLGRRRDSLGRTVAIAVQEVTFRWGELGDALPSLDESLLVNDGVAVRFYYSLQLLEGVLALASVIPDEGVTFSEGEPLDGGPN